MNTRLNDTMVAAALGDLNTTELDPATILALRLGDVLTSDQPIVTPEFQSELREHFTDEQILELGAALAVASGWQRMIEAFGIRPDSWTPETPPPVRPA
jgi:alkylhydroperoxidase family enzyme